MLSFEITNSGEYIKVYFDSDGLDKWINALTSLKSSPDQGNMHLMDPLSGEETLNDQNPWGKIAIGELIVSLA